MKKIPDYVVKQAKRIGFETAEYVGRWRGYAVYNPMSDEPVCGGLPMFILEKDGKARITEDGEWQEIMELFFDDEDD